jgi:hypothetical protein
MASNEEEKEIGKYERIDPNIPPSLIKYPNKRLT